MIAACCLFVCMMLLVYCGAGARCLELCRTVAPRRRVSDRQSSFSRDRRPTAEQVVKYLPTRRAPARFRPYSATQSVAGPRPGHALRQSSHCERTASSIGNSRRPLAHLLNALAEPGKTYAFFIIDGYSKHSRYP